MRCSLFLTIALLVLPHPVGAWQKIPEQGGGGFYGVTISDVGNLVLVTSVYQKTPAAKVARVGDLLLQLDGKPIQSTAKMIEVIGKRKPGSPAAFLVLRGDKEMLVQVKLGKRPAAGAMQEIGRKPTTLEMELSAYYQTLPSALAAWRRGLSTMRGGKYKRAAAYWAFCRARAVYSELPDAQGDKRKQLLLLARQAALMIRAMRAEIRLPENRGQTSVSQKSERQRIEKLIKQLGDQQYGVRQRAMTRLIAVGEAARSALVRARLSLDLEVRWRVAHILDSLRQANALEVQRMVPALWEVAAVDGRSVKLTRKLGPALNKNCEYRAVVMGDPNKRTVVFRSTGPDGLTLKSGLLAKGQTLAYLVLKKVADGKRGTGQ